LGLWPKAKWLEKTLSAAESGSLLLRIVQGLIFIFMGHAVSRQAETRALKAALLITSVVMVAEFIGGLWTNSLALLADAAHMLTDAAAIGLSLFAIWFIRRPATPEKTYGYFRVEILAALVNGTALLVIALFILRESYHRFFSPQDVKSLEMLLIASVGLVANLTSAWLLHATHKHSLNVRGAFFHVLGDAMGSVGAILAGGAMLLWQVYWADALAGALVSMLILFNAWRLVRDSVLILLEGAPAHVNLTSMREALCRVPGVESVHDLHVWTLTSGVHAMTCHAVVNGNASRNHIIQQMNQVSSEQFDVHHTTIQIEEEDLCQDLQRFCNCD
jgi:cobalt-zinc-cadmium efflux system protein